MEGEGRKARRERGGEGGEGVELVGRVECECVNKLLQQKE